MVSFHKNALPRSYVKKRGGGESIQKDIFADIFTCIWDQILLSYKAFLKDCIEVLFFK